METGIDGIASLEEKRFEIAAETIRLQWLNTPGLETLYGPAGRRKCEEDTVHHISYLFEAVRSSSYILFREYVAWAKVLLENLGLDTRYFKDNLTLIAAVLRTLDSRASKTATGYLEQAAAEMESMPSSVYSFLIPEAPLYSLASLYLEHLLAGDRRSASELILRVVDEGTPVQSIYRNVFEPVMREVGRLWQMNRLSVAQEHFCTAATQLIICQLYPHIFRGERNGKIFVGACVSSELHELGIRMVTDSFELAGWDTHFLGANTPSHSVIDHLEKTGADIIGLSATVAPHVDKVRQFITELRTHDSLKAIRIFVGGYAFNQDHTLWKSIGADAWAPDVDQAVEMAGSYVGLH